MTDCRTVQLTAIDAKDITDVNNLTKMSVRSDVTVSGGGVWEQKIRIPKHKGCGTNPKWEDIHLKFHTLHDTALTFDEVKMKVEFFSVRIGNRHTKIGEAVVPVMELLQNEEANGENPVSYPIRTLEGRTKGEVSFAYKFGEAHAGSGSTPSVNPPCPPQAGPDPPVEQPGHGRAQRPQSSLKGKMAAVVEVVSTAFLAGGVISNLVEMAASDDD